MELTKIGKIASQKYDGIQYQVGLNLKTGTVYIQIDSKLESESWILVGENIDVESPDKNNDAIIIATKYLVINEDVHRFKRYFD